MTVHRPFLWLAAGVALLGMSGCSAFRAAFDESPEKSEQRRQRAEIQNSRNDQRQQREGRSRVFPWENPEAEQREIFLNSVLSDEEQSLVRAQLDETAPADSAAGIHRLQNDTAGRGSDFVFGF